MLLETSTTLGPATVLGTDPEIRVRLEDDSEAAASLALGYPYSPSVGDSVLVIGQAERHFVIGVLRGTGATIFTAPADLHLRAPNGAIKLSAAENIEAEAPRVALKSNRLEFVARTMTEKLGSAYRYVKKLFQIRTGRMRTIAESTIHVKGERIVERAEKDVKIDGEHIRLG